MIICPVRVSLAHLGLSGSITFFLNTEKKLIYHSLFFIAGVFKKVFIMAKYE